MRKARGLHAEVEVFSYYSLPFKDPAVWTAERQELWARHVISRLSAYTTVFLWTVTNEYETYPEGKYRYDGRADDDWANNMGALFHVLDPHRHPTTVHNITFDDGGGIGRRFDGPDIDVLSHQKWGEAEWNGRYLQGDAKGVERAIWADRVYDKPVINTENGYEWLAGFPADFNRQVNGTDKSRRVAWRVFAAGGAAYAAGFAATWHGTDDYDWQQYKALRFQLDDMGLAKQLGHYIAFVKSTRFIDMAPMQDLVDEPNLCLANPGREYVVYAPGGGSIALDLTGVAARFDATWFDPRTGDRSEAEIVEGGEVRNFTTPSNDDWVLHLTRRDGSAVTR